MVAGYLALGGECFREEGKAGATRAFPHKNDTLLVKARPLNNKVLPQVMCWGSPWAGTVLGAGDAESWELCDFCFQMIFPRRAGRGGTRFYSTPGFPTVGVHGNGTFEVFCFAYFLFCVFDEIKTKQKESW